QPGEDETVDRVAHPLLVLDRGQSGPLDRLEGPVLALRSGRGLDRLAGGGPGALVDPALEQSNLRGIEARPLGRHAGRVVRAGDGVNDSAVGALAGDDDRPGVAAFEGSPGRVEAQARALLGGPVAGGAVLREDRLDVARVVDRVGGRGAGKTEQDS